MAESHGHPLLFFCCRQYGYGRSADISTGFIDVTAGFLANIPINCSLKFNTIVIKKREFYVILISGEIELASTILPPEGEAAVVHPGRFQWNWSQVCHFGFQTLSGNTTWAFLRQMSFKDCLLEDSGLDFGLDSCRILDKTLWTGALDWSLD